MVYVFISLSKTATLYTFSKSIYRFRLPKEMRLLLTDVPKNDTYNGVTTAEAVAIINKIGWVRTVTPMMIYKLKRGQGALRHRFRVRPQFFAKAAEMDISDAQMTRDG